MIGQLTPPPAIPALYEFRLLLELLSDADKYNAKVRELSDLIDLARTEAGHSDAAYKKATEQLTALRVAEREHSHNRDIANAQAENLAKQANDLSRKSKAYEDMCVERDAGYRTRVKELDAREAEIRDREANIEAKQAKADNAQAHASGLIGEYEAKLSQLKALVK